MVAATAITLSQLVQSLATAVVQAQQQVEDHQVAGLDRYFDPDGRPHSLTIRTRSLRPDAAADAEDWYSAPLLPLLPNSQLRIKNAHLELRAELADLGNKATAQPGDAQGSGAAAAAAVPELALVLANNSNEGSVRIRLELEAVEAGDGRSRLLAHLAKTQGFIDR